MKLPLNNSTSKTDLKVGGNMSEKGADIAGIILASSGLIIAIALATVMILLAVHRLKG